jgi:DNA repair ATPase RecN
MTYENTQLSPEQEKNIERAAERETRLEAAGQLRELAEQIYDLLDEMKDVLREAAPSELRSAEAYWLAHIDGALENREGWLGTSMISLNDTVESLEAEEEE